MRVKPARCCQVKEGVRITVLFSEITWPPEDKLLRKSEQNARRAERIRGGIGLDVIFDAQAVLVAHHVVDVGDSLIDVRLSIGSLHHGVVTQSVSPVRSW